MLTANTSEEYAMAIVNGIKSHNGEPIIYEGQQIPLSLHVAATKYQDSIPKYSELFSELHIAIFNGKE